MPFTSEERERVVTRREVVITDANVPFWSLVVLLIKIAFAAIPAGLIVGFVYLIFAAIFLGGL